MYSIKNGLHVNRIIDILSEVFTSPQYFWLFRISQTSLIFNKSHREMIC